MSEKPSLRQLMKRWKDGGESIDDLAATYGIPDLEQKIRREYHNLNLPAPKPKVTRPKRPKATKPGMWAPWTPEEDAVLVKGLKLHGVQMYAFLAKNLNRTCQAWQSRATKLKLSYGRQPWTREEEDLLMSGVMPLARTPGACETRRYQIKKEAQAWTAEEDEAIRQAYRDRPKGRRTPSFAHINRPPAACRMRWRDIRQADTYRKRKKNQLTKHTQETP